MKSKTIVVIILSIVLGASLVASGFVILASGLEKFIFVESLHVEEFKPHGDDSYVAYVLDDGVKVANFFVRVEYPRLQTLDVPVLVQIWHSEETELDSMFLKFFAGTGFIEAYLEVPGGSWPPIYFHQSRDGKGTVLEVDDLGFQGSGTVTLHFLLEAFPEQPSFNFEAKFSMHKKAFMQLTRQEAYAFTEIPFPT